MGLQTLNVENTVRCVLVHKTLCLYCEYDFSYFRIYPLSTIHSDEL